MWKLKKKLTEVKNNNGGHFLLASILDSPTVSLQSIHMFSHDAVGKKADILNIVVRSLQLLEGKSKHSTLLKLCTWMYYITVCR